MFRVNRVHANMCVCEGERKRKARVCGCGMCVSAFVCGWVGVYLCACLGLTESCVLPCCSSSRLSCSQLRRSGGLDVATELNKSCEHASTMYLSTRICMHAGTHHARTLAAAHCGFGLPAYCKQLSGRNQTHPGGSCGVTEQLHRHLHEC